jgi:hypothetical protein
MAEAPGAVTPCCASLIRREQSLNHFNGPAGGLAL